MQRTGLQKKADNQRKRSFLEKTESELRRGDDGHEAGHAKALAQIMWDTPSPLQPKVEGFGQQDFDAKTFLQFAAPHAVVEKFQAVMDGSPAQALADADEKLTNYLCKHKKKWIPNGNV